jgi:hypothetical protein
MSDAAAKFNPAQMPPKKVFKEGDGVRVADETRPGRIVGFVGKKAHVAFGTGYKTEWRFYWPREMELLPEPGEKGAL